MVMVTSLSWQLLPLFHFRGELSSSGRGQAGSQPVSCEPPGFFGFLRTMFITNTALVFCRRGQLCPFYLLSAKLSNVHAHFFELSWAISLNVHCEGCCQFPTASYITIVGSSARVTCRRISAFKRARTHWRIECFSQCVRFFTSMSQWIYSITLYL